MSVTHTATKDKSWSSELKTKWELINLKSGDGLIMIAADSLESNGRSYDRMKNTRTGELGHVAQAHHEEVAEDEQIPVSDNDDDSVPNSDDENS